MVYRTNTNARGFWLVKRRLRWKNFLPENFLEINWYFALTSYCSHYWPIEQYLRHIRDFFGGKTKSPCFDLFIHWLIKQVTNTYRNHFSRSYESRSIGESLFTCFASLQRLRELPKSRKWPAARGTNSRLPFGVNVNLTLSIIICLSLSDDATELNLWILKGYNNFSYLWKFEPDIANSFGKIFFEKLENLQRMYELINLFCHPAISQFLMVAISFDIACKELKISRLTQASFHGIRKAERKFPPVRLKAEIERTI